MLLFDSLKTIGSQPQRVYGLAKLHKENTPLRPVLSIPPCYKNRKTNQHVIKFRGHVQLFHVNATNFFLLQFHENFHSCRIAGYENNMCKL